MAKNLVDTDWEKLEEVEDFVPIKKKEGRDISKKRKKKIDHREGWRDDTLDQEDD